MSLYNPDPGEQIRMLNVRLTLINHAIACYLIDTINDPVERQRVAAQRFGKAVAKLTATEPPKIPDVDTGADGNNNQAKDKQ